MAKRTIAWLEIYADNRTALAEFYTELFGFGSQDHPDMSYTTLQTGNADEGFGIGIGQRSAENPGATTPYISSDDVAGDLEKIKAKGGAVVTEPMEIPTVGTIAIFSDPAGNVMALGDFTPMP